MAAHNEGYPPRCSCTMRTARSRSSGESLFDFFLAPYSQRNEPIQNQGQFTRTLICGAAFVPPSPSSLISSLTPACQTFISAASRPEFPLIPSFSFAKPLLCCLNSGAQADSVVPFISDFLISDHGNGLSNRGERNCAQKWELSGLNPYFKRLRDEIDGAKNACVFRQDGFKSSVNVT